ncbi:hypothetical protein EKH55_0838 [Sinorhizobium alkalisoli]|nr:hypothetical protein EKH55_0838 [Sinorhizobium alkalisoli]
MLLLAHRVRHGKDSKADIHGFAAGSDRKTVERFCATLWRTSTLRLPFRRFERTAANLPESMIHQA